MTTNAFSSIAEIGWYPTSDPAFVLFTTRAGHEHLILLGEPGKPGCELDTCSCGWVENGNHRQERLHQAAITRAKENKSAQA